MITVTESNLHVEDSSIEKEIKVIFIRKCSGSFILYSQFIFDWY